MNEASLTRFQRCSSCGVLKPLTATFFYRRTPSKGRHKHGFDYQCKYCRTADHYRWREANRRHVADYNRKWKENNAQHVAAYQRAWWEANKDFRSPCSPRPDASKVCATCRIEYPATTRYFKAHRRMQYGVYNRCRACLASGYLRPRMLARMYCPDGYKVCSRCLEAKPLVEVHFSRQSSTPNGFASACKLCQSEQRAEAKSRDPQRFLAYGTNYEARKQGAEGAYDGETVWQMYDDQQGLCAYCETPLFGSFEVEHMQPLSRGGRNDWTNLAIACKPCNAQKWAKTAEEFMEVIR